MPPLLHSYRRRVYNLSCVQAAFLISTSVATYWTLPVLHRLQFSGPAYPSSPWLPPQTRGTSSSPSKWLSLRIRLASRTCTNAQPSAAIEQRERRKAKSANKFGSPITLKSKIVAAVADPSSPSSVLVAEAAGKVRRVNLEVSRRHTLTSTPSSPQLTPRARPPRSQRPTRAPQAP